MFSLVSSQLSWGCVVDHIDQIRSTHLFSHEPKVLCSNIIVIMLLVLLRCGDIELNPGPDVSNLLLWSSNVRGLNSLMIDCILANVAR